jgi:hypothetical protein
MQKKKEGKKIEDQRVFDLIKAIRAAYKAADQSIAEPVVEQMKALREVFIELQHPTLVKSVRLVYEYFGQFGEFSIEPWEEDAASNSFEYYIELLENPFNKYNRDEIKELNNFLKGRINGEDVVFNVLSDDEEEEEEA